MTVVRSEELDQLAAALVAAQAEFSVIPKESENGFFQSKYADLATVVTKAAPVLSKHGLAISQWPSRDLDGRDILTTWLLHQSGQFIVEGMLLHLPKDDAQGQGSALTYARRYSFMAILGLVADEDDDGNAASSATSGSARPASASPPAAPPTTGTALATGGQVRLMGARSSHISQQDRIAILQHVAGVTQLEQVPKSKVDDVLTAFIGPVPTGEPDVPIGQVELPSGGRGDDDIPF